MWFEYCPKVPVFYDEEYDLLGCNIVWFGEVHRRFGGTIWSKRKPSKKPAICRREAFLLGLFLDFVR
jgi:hypothetical protein